MNSFFVFFSLLFFSIVINAQVDSTANKPVILLGVETGGTILNGKDPVTNKKYKWTQLRTAPYIGYIFNGKIILAIKGENEFLRSNYSSHPTLWGIGGFFRYQIRLKIKQFGITSDRLLVSGETGLYKVNYAMKENNIETYRKLQESKFVVALGINYRLWKSLHINVAVVHYNFSDFNSHFAKRLSFEYHF